MIRLFLLLFFLNQYVYTESVCSGLQTYDTSGLELQHVLCHKLPVVIDLKLMHSCNIALQLVLSSTASSHFT